MTKQIASMSNRREIERKAKEYVKIRGKGNVQMVLEHLEIYDLNTIEEQKSYKCIEALDEMIEMSLKIEKAFRDGHL